MEDGLVEALLEAKRATHDDARPDVIERRHAAGFLTPRERVAALLDPGSAIEFGALSGRLGDGTWLPERGGVDFVGTVDGQPVVTSSTDFTDHGGGYGAGRIPRLYALAYEHRWPVVLFSDGGGSRATVPEKKGPGGVDLNGRIGRFDLFDGLAELSGWVPTLAMVSGPSYAGHASLSGFSNFLVATRGSSIGIGGPPMVEAALGVRLSHQELAGVEMHETGGGIDLLVDSEYDGIAALRRYLSYYRDRDSGVASSTAGQIRSLVSRDGPYDMRSVVEALCDNESVFELRPAFAMSVITAFARLGGRSVGVLASQPQSYNGGAIDQDASAKIARFVELCDVYEYPIVSLIDTPGLVVRQGAVGESEQAGITRHHVRPFMAHHHRTVPLISIQVGRAGGLAGFAMGGFNNGRSVPLLRLAWPTARLAPNAEYGQPIGDKNVIDDVIDPRETRGRLIAVLKLVPRDLSGAAKKHPVDTW